MLLPELQQLFKHAHCVTERYYPKEFPTYDSKESPITHIKLLIYPITFTLWTIKEIKKFKPEYYFLFTIMAQYLKEYDLSLTVEM